MRVLASIARLLLVALLVLPSASQADMSSHERGDVSLRERADLSSRNRRHLSSQEQHGLSPLEQHGAPALELGDGAPGATTALLRARSGKLWLGTRQGLVRYDGAEFSAIPPPKGMEWGAITALHEDGAGDLWIGTEESGVVVYAGGTTTTFSSKDGLPSDHVTALAEDDAGGIWVGTADAGVIVLRGGRMIRVRMADGLAEAPVSALLAGTDGSMWMVAGATVTRLNADGEHIEPFPKPLGSVFTAIPSEPVHDGRVASANVPIGGVEFYEMPLFQLLCFIVLAMLILVAFRWRVQHLKAREEELLELIDLHTRHLREEKEKTERALAETDRARHEAEQQKVIAQNARTVIEEQAEKLRELDRIKTRFFSNVSHEFRTPLTLTIGPLENMLAGVYGPLQEHAHKQLDLALRNARRLLRLINQLLDLTKLESGKMDLAVSRGNIVPLVEGVVLSFTAFAEKKDLTLSFDCEESEIYLYFDPACLEKVLFNLISNAVKFTGDGGRILVTVEEGSAEIRGDRYEVVCIRVEDSGIGIPDEQLPYIFDRFHQVDGAMAHAYEGTGIGLSLVKELVELHHGSITVRSEHGVGSEFSIALPKGVDHFGNDVLLGEWPGAAASDVSRGPMMELAVLNDADELWEEVLAGDNSVQGDGGSWPSRVADLAPVTRPLPAPARKPSHRLDPPAAPSPTIRHERPRRRVLVIDDNPDVIEYVTIALARDYDVRSAADGYDGLAKAREEVPSLIISDVMMPGMDGYELCRRVKADETLRQIPVILLTAKAALNDKVEGLEAGSDDYISKPFSTRELRARIRNLLTVRDQQHMLSDLNSELSEKNDALREASEMKSQLLAIAAHDMKNPLNAIREFARILKDEVGETSNHYDPLDLIQKSSDQMLQLVSTLLDSAALETGQITLECEPLDMNQLAAAVVRRNEKLAERKKQTIDLVLAPEQALVSGDRSRILEAMDNLLNNAVKYSPPMCSIRVSVRLDGSSACFSVADEGPGFSEDDRSKLFRKFQRLSAQPTGGETSTGLGLAIVKQIVEMHDGRISLKSEQGLGSTFVIALPLLAGHGATATAVNEISR